MEDRLFEAHDRLADDVFVLSEAIDSLVEARVSLEDFLGSVASRLNRVVEGDVFGRRLRGTPDGGSPPAGDGPGAIGSDTTDLAFRIHPPLPAWASRFVGQRLAHAVRVIAHHDSVTRVEVEADDRVRELLSALGTEACRQDVLQKLGLDNARTLTVVAIAGAGQYPEKAARLAEALAGGTTAPSARMGDALAVILRHQPRTDVGIPTGLSVGLGEALPPNRVHDSWEGARTALRFSLPSRHSSAPHRMIDAVVVDIRKVGCLRILADAVDRRGVRDLRDVQAIEGLARNGLPDTLNVLEAVAATESIRQAAQLVHLHHNTVAHRVEAAESVLGFPLREIYGRTRLLIALTLYRLSRRSQGFGPDVTVERPRTRVSLGN
ncbi:helix-turn-helix domain-containing protein [Corynebacterium comes]|uniref:helix-turn-helix domain-containing protein n=1 Tax=Corynebacterium comes TaxID=2675218 RepID=UPI0018CD0330|nr:helix-turn-helix domain-containing protein [Corynebacterium comes]